MKVTVSVRSITEMERVNDAVTALGLRNLEIEFSFLPKAIEFPFDMPILSVNEGGYPVRHVGEAAFDYLKKLAA